MSEAAELFGEETWLLRFDDDRSMTLLAQHGDKDAREPIALRASYDAGSFAVLGSGSPVRVDDYSALAESAPEFARELGVVASAAAPLIVQGALWGALLLVSRGPSLREGAEQRLAQFADLAASAIANAQSLAELRTLADEQAALRRVAELVARAAPTQEVFDQVTIEASRMLADTPTALLRYEPSGAEVVIAAVSRPMEVGDLKVGAHYPVDDEMALGRVWRTGRAARIDDYDAIPGANVPAGVVAAVLAPIVVDGRLWGTISAFTPDEPVPAGTEERLARFCELVAAAIANAESRAALTASRARIAASADEARRRLARDVHDGAQQRLVHALITLRQAQTALQGSDTEVARLVDESLGQAQSANAQLRELANGILPAALARGGLRAGVDSLLEHIPLSVQAEVLAGRLPAPVEIAAYFVIAEALTNVIKHAGADRARIRALVSGDRLEVEVSDDGRGGADPAGGSGLIGLIDRVEAAGGSLSVSSPPGAGTSLAVALPIDAGDPKDA